MTNYLGRLQAYAHQFTMYYGLDLTENKNKRPPYCLEASFILHFSILYLYECYPFTILLRSFLFCPFAILLLINNKGSSFFPFI